jgi:MFS family permease
VYNGDLDYGLFTLPLEASWLVRSGSFPLKCYVASLTIVTGFDWGASGYVTALPSFQKQYGIPYPEQASGYLVPARYLSDWSGAATGGDIIGILIAGQLIEWIGRKHSLLIGTILTAVGIGMQFASHEWILFLCGRLVNGKHYRICNRKLN